MIYVYQDWLEHYGTKFHSGRYPYGSGENPFQHDATQFKARIAQLKDEGLSETEIAKYFGINTTQLRTLNGLATQEIRAQKIERAAELHAQGMTPTQIAKEMGLPNESSARSLLNEESKMRTYAVSNVVTFLKNQVDEKGMIDVGLGVEYDLNISRKKLQEALYVLETEGYITYKGSQEQVTNKGQFTHTMVLTPPGTEHKEIYNLDEVHSLTDYKFDSNDPYAKPQKKWQYPESMDSNRLEIRYAEDGGKERDGLIYLKRGVDDISLGESSYAQVRILVDGTHYLKGMAAYGEDDMFPPGKDVIFNTNKTKDVPMESVLKKIKDDPDNPFGVLLKENGGQTYYTDENGEKHLNLLNRKSVEGDWNDWQDTLPNQFLSKQNLKLVTNQLNISKANKEDEFEEIMALTQPTLKKEMLKSFADDCDAAAVDLKAAALPDQKYKVLLPVSSLKDNEAYCPTLKDGEEVALVRFPHAGTFEIPVLKVNNKNKEAQKMFGEGTDAIGINANNASVLSGADFDGDTVLVIPTRGKIKINSKEPLKALKDFDPSVEYPPNPNRKVMNSEYQQKQMGVVSNLITDMTIKGATDDELARAVRHSMVVIDAVKHEYDYRKSYEDNGIAELKKKYQGRYETQEDGSTKFVTNPSTLLSRAKNEKTIPKRLGSPTINPDTGEYVYKEDPDRFYVDKKTGKQKERTVKSTQMAEAKDAYSLVSTARTPVELAYADYANHMKDLGNKARKAMVNMPDTRQSPSAARTYAKEKNELEGMLQEAQRNKPRERQAQRLAASTVKAMKESDPEFAADKKAIKKKEQQALTDARLAVGAKRSKIIITDKQWEAIQSGAVSANTLRGIYQYADKDELKKKATPRGSATKIRPGQVNRMKAMQAAGATRAEIAQALGVSVSTVNNYLSSS